MKKIFIAFCTVVLLFSAITAPNLFHNQKFDLKSLPVVNLDGFLVENPETLNQLEEWSPIIVKGTLLNDSVNHEPVDDERYISGYTITSLKIDHVYKGDLEEGSTVPYGEGYYVINESDGPKLVTMFGCTPSIPGEEYIFFLTKETNEDIPWSGTYMPTSPVRSRYPVLSSSTENRAISMMSNSDLNIRGEEQGVYRKLLEEVSKKYR